MLKIESIVQEADKIVEKNYGEYIAKGRIIDLLVDILKEATPLDFAGLEASKFPYLIATPLETPSKTFEIDTKYNEYIALAADGSEIPINEDFYFPYYVINIGFIVEKYGDSSFVYADSEPKIYYEEQDLYEELEKPTLVKGELLTAKMLLQESNKLRELIKTYCNGKIPSISLFDGTLIQWEVKETSEAFKKRFLYNFTNLMGISFESGVPIAGYISGTHSKDVMGSIRYHLLQKDVQYDERIISSIIDTEIFSRILKKHERSALFKSNAPVLSFYSFDIYFFFLHTGEEIVRVEIPEFIARTEKALSNVCTLILNQVEKGHGYPVVLREAHEQAVIRESEKLFIEEMFSDLLQKKGIPFHGNAKSLSKRIRNI